MYGPLLSVLLMGMIPVWGTSSEEPVAPGNLFIAPPAAQLLAESPLLTIPGRLSASGILITDLESGQTLYERDSKTARPMASLTKLMTALLITENHSLDEWVPISTIAASAPGSSANLPAGDEIAVGDLLSGLLIPSGNDAALALARYDSGTAEAFVDKMNARAVQLGLRSTFYANPMGLDDPLQISSPQDVTWLSMFVMRNTEIAKRMAMRGAQTTTKKGVTLSITHTHALLHAANNAVVAGKTGTTEEAGQCLLSIVEYDNRRYLVVLLSSSDRYGDMRAILPALAP